MPAIESTLPILLVILSLGLIVPELFKKLHLPWVTILIILGAILGPHGVNYVQQNEVIEFFGFLGFTFLMLMAGLQTKPESLKDNAKSISIMAAANGLIPFVVGFGLAKLFDYSNLSALLVGTIFVSSSVAMVVPTLKAAKFFGTKEGKLIVSAVVIEDIASLLMLALIFQNVAPVTNIPLPAYFTILVLSVGLLMYALPKLASTFINKRIINQQSKHEDQLRFVMVVLIAILLYFSSLGVHPIVAAFLVGMLLSGVITSEIIYEKIHTLSYGLFVPVFFFIVGMEMDFSSFTKFEYANLFPVVLLIGLIGSKFLSGYISGRFVGVSPKSSTVFGMVTTIQLTTTLAATYTANQYGLLDDTLLTSIVMLSIVTTLVIPFVIKAINKRSWKSSS